MADQLKEQTSLLPLKSRFIFESDDLLAARDHLAKFLGRHTINPLEKNHQVRFCHCAIEIGQVSVNALQYGAAIRIGVRPQENTFLLLMLLQGTGTVKQGDRITELNERSAYIFNPDMPAVLELSAEQINFTIKLPMSAFTSLLERESGRKFSSEIEFLTHTADAQTATIGLRSFLKFLCNEIDEGKQKIDVPLINKQYEQTLLGLVLTELPHNCKEFIGMESQEAAPQYIQRVEKFVAEKYASTLSLSNLANRAAISERALQNGFRRFRSTTPMEYLRDYRLNIARQKLSDDKFSDMQISEIATNCGFSHLSKFAKCYRQRYGETPSETRKKVMSP